MKWQLGWVALAFVACRSSEAPSSLPLSGNDDGAAALVTIPAAGDGGTRAAQAAGAGGPIVAIAFAESGALVVQTEKGLTSIAPDGTRSELPLPPHAVASLGRTLGTSLAVQVDDDVLLVNLAPLAVVFRAHGRPVGEPEIGMVRTTTDGSHDIEVLALSPGTRSLVRLRLEDGLDGHVEEMVVTPNGHFAVVTVAAEQGGETRLHSFSYALATGQRIAEVLPVGQLTLLPNATFFGDHEIGFRGHDLVEIDLASGATVKKTAFPCKSQDAAQVGNAIVDASGTRLLATCEWDGVLLDARTFRRVKTYKHIVPGCDNGYALPAHFRADGKQLIIEGCGGEAHLDLASGKYACGDDDGLMGRPYEELTPTTSPRPKPSIPSVPACRSSNPSANAEVSEAIELSAHWLVQWSYDDKHATVMASGLDSEIASAPIKLDDIVGPPVISPGEDRLAATIGNDVIIRELPSGKILKQFEF